MSIKMKRICAWCNKLVEEGASNDRRVKHTICEACLPGWKAESYTVIAKYRKDKEMAT